MPGIIFELKSVRPNEVRFRHELKTDAIKREKYLQEEAIRAAVEKIDQKKYHARFHQHGIQKVVTASS